MHVSVSFASAMADGKMNKNELNDIILNKMPVAQCQNDDFAKSDFLPDGSVRVFLKRSHADQRDIQCWASPNRSWCGVVPHRAYDHLSSFARP